MHYLYVKSISAISRPGRHLSRINYMVNLVQNRLIINIFKKLIY